MMSGLLARRLFPIYCMSRDPVTRWLSLLRTFQHYTLLQSSIMKNDAICIHQRKQIHMSCVKLKMKKEIPEEFTKSNKKVKVAYIRPNMTVTELAKRISVPLDDVLTSLVLITEEEYEPDQEVRDVETSKQVCEMLKRKYKVVKMKDTAVTQVEDEHKEEKQERESRDLEKQGPADPNKLVSRSPVVTIMGHVDHGKTTLLDALRHSSVVDQEFGGITQHIGAFNVQLPSGHSITFLDTPGHAAFTNMRARGASVTDIVVLVIAAEDGIMAQTVESIKHARASNVPLIVAINKIDKYGVNIDMIKSMLSVYGVTAEELGGDVQVVPISALKKINLGQLEECITTLAEFLELKGDPVGMVEGRVIETKTDPQRGKLATLLIQRGTLKKGDLLLAGTAKAKVRSMNDSNGKAILRASLSMPVEVGGWRDLPDVGDEVLQVKTEKRLKKVLGYRQDLKAAEEENERFKVIEERRTEEREIYVQKREEKFNYFKQAGFRSAHRSSIQTAERRKGGNLLPQLEEEPSARPKFNIVIKGDVAGSVEAILNTLGTFRSEICDLDIMHSGVGDVTHHDIQLAELFEGKVFAFNVGMANDTHAQKDTVKMYNVIYELFDDLVEFINDKLPDEIKEETVGEAIIQQEYVVSVKQGTRSVKVGVAGSRCTSGNLQLKHLFKIVRDDQTIYNGTLAYMKHFQMEVNKIVTDQECGICFSTKTDVEFKPGDKVICYKNVQKKQTLDWEPGAFDASVLMMTQS